LKFEGEYLNGKKWNGIIYNEKNNFKFEIKDGNGKFKEYDYKGNLIFEGELINGEKKGKQYDYKGNLLFEGEYLNGIEWNGKIKKYEKIEPYRFRCGCGYSLGFNMFDYEEEDNSEIGNEKELGKPVGNDRERGKCTYVTKYGLGKAQEMLDNITEDAISIIKNYNKNSEFLVELAKYINTRNK
jgi:geranylgeranyl diphosphate synthase type II